MSLGDMFFKVDGSRSGAVKGEANDTAHAGEIDILDWSWGMRSPSAMGGGGAAGKTALDALNITKRVDSASTALMSVMRNNELIKKGVLTVRKSGSKPVEYFIVTIENARITSYDVATVDGAAHQMVEKLSLSFQKISIDYYPQDGTGSRKGGSNFSTDVGPNT
ncbi:type VI secretion system tube protein Hcp [Aquabacterium sp.]|uniref:Hcp family type VI secretion system effector n=1 Tax=Aquabacterium sp. TaxID=1872578 RepID=UPI00198A79B3|nr:type VI secretion system tube protein Hcp [Aquabacterium sp.]MBC7699595.1 type VI secretion system tube protein Hcp [Aquabacterium sp.]